MTKTYDYDPAKRLFRPIRWSCALAEKAQWHVQLARIIANDLFREVLSGPDGLIFAVQKYFLRWIIDGGSGFDLVSGQSITKEDGKIVVRTESPCRMATANGITVADEQLAVQVDGLDAAVDAIILDNSPCNVLALRKLCME